MRGYPIVLWTQSAKVILTAGNPQSLLGRASPTRVTSSEVRASTRIEALRTRPSQGCDHFASEMAPLSHGGLRVSGLRTCFWGVSERSYDCHG